MELKEYLRVLFKRGWLVALVALVTMASALAFSKAQVPVYRATINLSVRPSRITDWGSVNSIKILLRNYAWNIKNDVARARRVSELLQMDLSAYQLLGMLEVAPVESDLLIRIAAKDPTPSTARLIVERFAQLFAEDTDQDNLKYDKQDQIFVSVAGEAEVARYSPKTKINTAAGLLLGLILGGVLAFGLEYLDDTIKTAEDVERYVEGLTVLGSIPTITASETSPGRRPSWRWLATRLRR